MSQVGRLIKLAQVIDDLGDPKVTGRSVSEIIRFLMRKIPYNKRPYAIMALRKKVWELNEYDMASKKSPNTASMGQAITFIKTLLNGRQPAYIRSVLAEIVKSL